MSAAAQDDEARWAQAQSLLDRVPDETAEQRLRRARRTRLLIVISIVLAMTAAGLVVALLLMDRSALRSDRDVPTWQAVGGLVVSGLGLVWVIAVLAAQIRITSRVQGWRSPLYVLTRGQRKELLAQVRGRGPDRPERVPLARHMAQLLLLQQLQWGYQVGMLVLFTGNWMIRPAPWRLWLIGLFAALVLTGAVLFRRQGRRIRAFLDEHPAPDPH